MKKAILLLAGLALFTFKNQAQTVTDVEGNIYNTIVIGTQVWMQENLRTTKYNDGTSIAYPGSNVTTWQNNITGAYAWYNNDSVNNHIYGALYKWYTLSPANNGGKSLCPSGWHVPTHNEWTTLERALCTSATCVTDFPLNNSTIGNRGTDEGGKMKETGTVHWWSNNTGATNSSGFTALPGGYRLTSGSYSGNGSFAYLWTSTVDNNFSYNAWLRDLYYDFTTIERITFRKDCGLSVRCICDTLTTGTNSKPSDQGIEIFPNPAHNSITIKFENGQETLIRIFNTIGVCVINQKTDNNSSEIDISNLSDGVYLILITGADWNIRRQFVKE